jgi:hypothetical protein
MTRGMQTTIHAAARDGGWRLIVVMPSPHHQV